MAASEFGSLRHLVIRFFGALWPAGPRPADEIWARRWLLPGEAELWGRMSGPDRRHAVGVARDVISLLGETEDTAERAVVASALLHDVGKIEAHFGTIARALVTMLAMVTGRTRLVAELPPGAARWRVRVRDYLRHDSIGAELLRTAGSDSLTVAWAGEHHRDPAAWTTERRLADALKAADGD
jgi:hypothetical protein